MNEGVIGRALSASGGEVGARMPHVPNELERLQNAVGELESQLEGLAKRLEPVLRDEPPANTTLIEPVAEALVPTAAKIQTARMTVNRCISTARSILTRLEV